MRFIIIFIVGLGSAFIFIYFMRKVLNAFDSFVNPQKSNTPTSVEASTKRKQQALSAQEPRLYYMDEASLESILTTIKSLKRKKSIPEELLCSISMLFTQCLLYKQVQISQKEKTPSSVSFILTALEKIDATEHIYSLNKPFITITQNEITVFLAKLLITIETHEKQYAFAKEQTKNTRALLGFYKQSAVLAQHMLVVEETMQKEIAVIVTQTQFIIQCMIDTPENLKHGTQFLQRYLPAVATITEKYLNLGCASLNTCIEDSVLGKYQTLLQRLVKAFRAEHNHLLVNDTMTFTAELESLDALLDIHGK